VMVEDVARTTWLALQIGIPEEISPEDVARLHYRYTHIYGQQPDDGRKREGKP
jgi:L-ribulose-5-phosphate 4-epimerase